MSIVGDFQSSKPLCSLCEKKHKKTKKVLDKKSPFQKDGIMMIFELEFKRKAFGFESPMRWMYSKEGETVKVTKKGRIFLTLFWVTFFAFAFLTFYMSQCITPPIVDAPRIGQGLEFDISHELSPHVYVCVLNPVHDFRYYSQLIGVFDPNRQFSAHLGFSHNYPNYMRSIPYKFL